MATTNYNFISEPDPDLKCTICLDLVSNPKQCEDCGKLFCSECIEKNGKKPCPNCRTNNPRYFKDIKSDRDIKTIVVRCANIKRGCAWTGTIGTLDNHVSVCEYTEVACAYESLGCGVRMMRKDIKKHEVEINSGHFNLMLGIVQSQSEQYKTLSEKHKTLSEQHKTLSEQHKTLSEQHKILSEEHSTLLEQNKILSEQYHSLAEKHKIQSEQLQPLSNKHKTLSEGEALLFKLPGYTSKKYKDEVFHSTLFHTHPSGYRMCICIHANGNEIGLGTHMSLYAKVLEGPYDDQLHWPFLGTVKCELLNQLEDDKHYSSKIICDTTSDMLVGSSWGNSKFLPHSSLYHNPATNTQYLLDDALYFRVSVKVDNHKPWLADTDKINIDAVRAINDNKLSKNEKRYFYKLSGYNSIKGKNNKFYSDSFYTSSDGYKMSIETYPNGYAKSEGTHVSVYVNLLEGSYDATLSWPFLGTVTLTLLNQLSDENHHTIILQYTNTTEYGYVGKTFGYHRFISHSALPHDPVKNTQYLKNDTLYFRVSVKDNTHKSWLTCIDK